MPSFKHKTNKKIIIDKKSIITLDGKHKELQGEFNDINKNIIPELKNEKKNNIFYCIICH